ncbi:MAG: YtfJ family protein [Pseudomonadota bacterium]
MRTLLRCLATLSAIVFSGSLAAQAPTVGSPLPPLAIDDRGELMLSDGDLDFKPWNSSDLPGNVYVIQYFGATMSDSKIFEPLTNQMQQQLPPDTAHVTTIINMDKAMWGTTGFVMSELKKNKQQHPLATMVVDEDGKGATTWELDGDSVILIVMDKQGMVKFISKESLSDEQLTSTIDLIKSLAAT